MKVKKAEIVAMYQLHIAYLHNARHVGGLGGGGGVTGKMAFHTAETKGKIPFRVFLPTGDVCSKTKPSSYSCPLVVPAKDLLKSLLRLQSGMPQLIGPNVAGEYGSTIVQDPPQELVVMLQ